MNRVEEGVMAVIACFVLGNIQIKEGREYSSGLLRGGRYEGNERIGRINRIGA